ncbi:hypothetical protein K438DRAFT_1974902 [Mycena galopus ATCC 62051]|nr:hypothetical protein K438DRAFT_1974902 [Mycena galopus ATCC 62051]
MFLNGTAAVQIDFLPSFLRVRSFSQQPLLTATIWRSVSSPSSASPAPSAPRSPLVSTVPGAPVPVLAATPEANTPAAAADPPPALLPAIIAFAAAFIPALVMNIAQKFRVACAHVHSDRWRM